MNDWKDRLKAEYTELKERIEKLHRWNVKMEADYRAEINGICLFDHQGGNN